MNHLSAEKSPYLLQHAENPVDWYPWGEAALSEARRQQKPIFLSIGYSTCHWCHVMAHESFESEEAAALLNAHFIAVKVDREERPDLDTVYMAACQALTGSGGWPLTVLLTPDQEPFWAGTYLPPHSRYGQLGLVELLTEAARLWEEDRAALLDAGRRIAAHIAVDSPSGSAAPGKSLLRRAKKAFQQQFDPQGGFGGAPKFPVPHSLLFLLAYAQLERDHGALQMAEATLLQMARGGIFDQLGGGFARYSTDERWLVPHFEKTLYDNALLAIAYLEAFRQTGKSFYRAVAQKTLDYLLRELKAPEGGFYCGQDADSGGEEGGYYLFTKAELEQVLGERADSFCRWFGVEDRGCLEGKSILNLLDNPRYANPPAGIDAACEKLFHYRRSRMPLGLDDKVLTSWNGLAIAAFARAGLILGEARYLQAARETASFLASLVRNNRPFLCWRKGEAAIPGQLDDYAFLSWGLLELYAADPDPTHLLRAAGLASEMLAHFDGGEGGLYLTADDDAPLIYRPRTLYDGALPSGAAAASLVLLRLARLSGEARFQAAADRQLCTAAGEAAQYPTGCSFSLFAMAEALYPPETLVCCTREALPGKLLPLCAQKRIVPLIKTPERAVILAKAAPFTASYPVPEEGLACYLCKEGRCGPPLTGFEALEEALGG